MRFYDSELTHFKEIMYEFFYDWGMTHGFPQIKKDGDGYWINKTSLFKEENEYYLTYKMNTWKVSKEAFNDFKNFYENLYKNDPLFEKILDNVSHFYFDEGVTLSQNNLGFFIGPVSIITNNGKFYMIDKNQNLEINKKTFEKVRQLWSLLS